MTQIKVSEYISNRLAEPRASVRIEAFHDDFDNFTQKDSYSRRYIQKPKVTHFERKMDLTLAD